MFSSNLPLHSVFAGVSVQAMHESHASFNCHVQSRITKTRWQKVALITQLRVDGRYYDIIGDAGRARTANIKVAVAVENCW